MYILLLIPACHHTLRCSGRFTAEDDVAQQQEPRRALVATAQLNPSRKPETKRTSLHHRVLCLDYLEARVLSGLGDDKRFAYSLVESQPRSARDWKQWWRSSGIDVYSCWFRSGERMRTVMGWMVIIMTTLAAAAAAAGGAGAGAGAGAGGGGGGGA